MRRTEIAGWPVEVTTYSVLYNISTLYQDDHSRDTLGRITTRTETIGGITTTHDYRYDLAGRNEQLSGDAML